VLYSVEPDETEYVFACVTNNVRYTSQTQQIYYGVRGQVKNNMFQPFFTLIRPSSGQAR